MTYAFRTGMIALLVAFSVGHGVQGQGPRLPKVQQFGVDGFRLMLQHQGLEVSQTRIATALEDAPESTVMVILGDLSLVPRFREQMERFVRRGGALLIASDLQEVQVRSVGILGTWVQDAGPISSGRAYRGFRDCPVVTRFDRGVSILFDDVRAVVANRPGSLALRSRNVRPIAWLPSSRRAKSTLMATYQRGRGRMLFLADHSIFINGMLIHGDNARFASNVCQWLCEDGNRERLVIVHDGHVLPKWGLGQTPPAIPLASLLRAVQRGGWEDLPIGDSVLPVVNASIADFQQSNQFNILLHRLSNGMFGPRPLRVVLLILMGLILAILFKWLSFSRSKPRNWFSRQDWRDPIEPRLVQASRRKQYQPCLRILAREFFAEAGFQDWSSRRPPKVVVNGRGEQARLSRGIRKLWRMAAEGRPLRVTKRRLRADTRLLGQLRELQLSGDLSLE